MYEQLIWINGVISALVIYSVCSMIAHWIIILALKNYRLRTIIERIDQWSEI